jgi:DNA-3-methyladenine glycosylase I
VTRCFGDGDPLYEAYHDDEWGRPVTDERGLYERISLEAFQSGLSWLTILRKREAFRAAFAGFEPDAVARFGERDVTRLMADAGIVRNRAKIEAAMANARATLTCATRARPCTSSSGRTGPSSARHPPGWATCRPGRPRPSPWPRSSSARAFASWGRRRSMPPWRPAGWSTTTSPRARCATRSSACKPP